MASPTDGSPNAVASAPIAPPPLPTHDILRYLMGYRWLIVAVTIVAGAVGYGWARWFQPEYFKSTIMCVPPKSDNGLLGGALGGVSSALKDIGLSKIGGKGGDSYEFIALLYSRSLRDSMIRRFDLRTEYEMQQDLASEVRSAFEENLEIDLKAEGNYEISVWSRDTAKAVVMCEAFVEAVNELANRIAREEATKSVGYLERRLAMMDSTIAALTDSLSVYGRRYMLFSPEDQAKASATAMADVKAGILKEETMLGLLELQYGAGDPTASAQRSLVESLKQQYDRIQRQPGFAGNFSLPDAAGIGARYLIITAEFEAYSKVKAFLMPSLEQARLDMSRNTPSLIVVDAPERADKRSRPKRVLVGLGAGFGSGIMTLLLLLLAFGWRSLKRSVQA